MYFQNGSVGVLKLIIICLLFLCNLLLVAPLFASGEVKIEAQYLDYESVCKLTSPKNPPSSIIWSKGSWSQTGCSNIEKTFNNPSALKIIIQNNSAAEYQFSVKRDFDNFAMKDAKSPYKPVALQVLSGGFLGYLTKIPNTLKMVVDANKEAEVVVLFDKISKGATIQFEGFDPIKIK